MSDRLSEPELLHIVNFSPVAVAVYTTTDMIIEMANEAMLALWGKDSGIIGKPLIDGFSQMASATTIRLLQSVWNSGNSYYAKNTTVIIDENGKTTTRYFDFTYQPVKDNTGKVYCILHTAIDVTERVQQTQVMELLQSRQMDVDKELTTSIEAYNKMELINKNFLANSKNLPHTVLKGPVATAVLSGPDLKIESANEYILQMWGKSAEVIGKPLIDALPELQEQPFPDILQKVYTTGEAYYGNSERAVLEMDGRTEERYFNFVYQPLKTAEGQVTGIMIVANDVSEQVIFHTNIQLLNSKLTASNEELCETNKQLTSANKKLEQSQAHLQTLYNQLEESEVRFKEVIKQAPVAIIIFQGKDMLIETVNAHMQELLQRDENIIGQPLLTAIPELAGQQSLKLLHHVFITGHPIHKFDEPIKLKRKGMVETGYFNFSYTPLVQSGKITGVINMAVEVTSQVRGRQAVQQLNDSLTGTNNKLHDINDELLMANDDLASAQRNLKTLVAQLRENESNLHQAIQSGNVGTWSIDLATEKITMSEHSCHIFGFSTDAEITIQDIEQAVEPSYFPILHKALSNAIESGADSDTCYPITHRLTQQRRWVRAIGKVYDSKEGKKKNYAGTLMDITEQKQDEQRKNEFINTLSQELKSPLSSIKANVELLQKEVGKNESTSANEILTQLTVQINKMDNIMNDFRNTYYPESN